MGKIMYKNMPFSGTFKIDHIELTQLDYDALSTAEKNDPNKVYFVRDGIPTPSTLADYVVEQGTDGIWTYRKWNSGIAECWGQTSVASRQYAANGGYYNVTENLPSGLFNASPNIVIASGRIATVVQTDIGFTSPNDANVIQTYLINRNSSAVTQAGVVYWMVKGRWK